MMVAKGPERTAFERGKNAYGTEEPNPYPAGSILHTEWLRGHRQADAQQRKQP